MLVSVHIRQARGKEQLNGAIAEGHVATLAPDYPTRVNLITPVHCSFEQTIGNEWFVGKASWLLAGCTHQSDVNHPDNG
ncbi:hypothetical protein J0895_00635 [Phormidium pseudopriestleyi FRX01]|uniref:Uncharacterized protein n=1 Tax=Phormidium pseudopriestleyi FRX01 TaxID=1759528 RepID=A0ABS3FMK0_9CYAN|nr:hypothetical protein [Phormidium pseudopriestleyi]MBO0347637.1 hypothetical protein [Phormidium pseudopriestleyi FRX01]